MPQTRESQNKEAQKGNATEGGIPFEESPVRLFHLHLAFGAAGGEFADGFELGIIGIAIAIAAVPLHLTAVWMGLLGSGAFAGLFFGSLITGMVVDRLGRRDIYRYNMLFMGIISGSQFFAHKPWELLCLRIGLGLVLGSDWVVCKALVNEFSPVKVRGKLLSYVSIGFTLGIPAAYLVGYWMRNMGPDAWRYMLGVSSIPAFIFFIFRLGIPESPLWLLQRGRFEEAIEIVHRKLGSNFCLPKAVIKVRKSGGEWAELFSKKWRTNTFIGAIFYTCQIIPYYAFVIFMPKIFGDLHVNNKLASTIIVSTVIVLGGILGIILIDRISRRMFLIGSFYACAVLLAVLALDIIGPIAVVIVSCIFVLINKASCNLELVYPIELFPTHLRGTGVGFSVAISRFGGMWGTFLMPIFMKYYGIGVAVGSCVIVCLIGGICCQLWAPETGKMLLSAIGEDQALPISS